MRDYLKEHSNLIIGIIIIVLLFVSKSMTTNFYLMRAFKFILLLIVPMVLRWLLGKESVKLKPSKSPTLQLSLFVFAVILLAYIALSSLINPDAIASDLISGYGLTKAEIIKAGLYTIFINAFCEEYFFRYFLLNFNKEPSIKTSILSASLFSLYHLSIMTGWFSPLISILAFTGLFIGGMIFNWIRIKTKSIINTYIVHAVADASIILVGFNLLGIINIF